MVILYADTSKQALQCVLALRGKQHVTVHKCDPGTQEEFHKACRELAPGRKHQWPAVLTHETEMLFGEAAVEYCQHGA